jgi:hypothetical protein
MRNLKKSFHKTHRLGEDTQPPIHALVILTNETLAKPKGRGRFSIGQDTIQGANQTDLRSLSSSNVIKLAASPATTGSRKRSATKDAEKEDHQFLQI